VWQLFYLVLQTGHLTSSHAACRLQAPVALLYFTWLGSQLVVQVLDGRLSQGLHLHHAPKQYHIGSWQTPVAEPLWCCECSASSVELSLLECNIATWCVLTMWLLGGNLSLESGSFVKLWQVSLACCMHCKKMQQHECNIAWESHGAHSFELFCLAQRQNCEEEAGQPQMAVHAGSSKEHQKAVFYSAHPDRE